jgi:hypothetical protein
MIAGHTKERCVVRIPIERYKSLSSSVIVALDHNCNPIIPILLKPMTHTNMAKNFQNIILFSCGTPIRACLVVYQLSLLVFFEKLFSFFLGSSVSMMIGSLCGKLFTISGAIGVVFSLMLEQLP